MKTLYVVASGVMPPKRALLSAIVAVSNTQINVSGTPPVDDGAGLKDVALEYSLNGISGWTLVSAQSSMVWAHAGLVSGQQYWYRAYGRDNLGQSGAYSNILTASAGPTTPVIGAQALSVSALQIDLLSASSEYQVAIASYSILRSATGLNGSFAQIASITAAQFPYAAGGLSASTRYYFSAQALDANGIASALAAVVSARTSGVVSSAQRYPLLGSHMTGGSPRAYDRGQYLTYAQCCRINLLNAWDGWQQGDAQARVMTLAQVVDNIHALSRWPGGSLVANYWNALTIDPVNGINAARLTASNYWLRTAYPSGAFVAANFWSPSYRVANIASAAYAQYVADYEYNFQVAGNVDASLNVPGRSNAANPNLDGYYNDDLFFSTPEDGDWLQIGSSQLRADATASQRMRDGRALQFNRLLSKNSAKYLLANISQLQNVVNQTGLTNLLHGGHMEGMLGNTWSKETSGGGWGVMMAAYQRQMDFCIAPKLCTFGHSNVTTDGRDYYRTTPFQAIRYGLTSCLMGDGIYTPDSTAGFALTNGNSSYSVQGAGNWFDEFAVDPNSGVALTYPNVNAGLGYLGTPNEPGVVTTAWQQGVMRRTFTNAVTGKTWWVLCNPNGNGARTLNLGISVTKLSGSQAPTINNGATVSSITLQDSDGIIVRL